MCLTLVFYCSVTCQVTELFYILHIIRKDTTKPASIKKTCIFFDFPGIGDASRLQFFLPAK